MPTSLPRLTPARQSTVSTLGSLVSRARQAIQPPKAKTKREQQKEELFSHYVLNKDPEASKYMPYDEVAYPSRVRKARDVGELQESAPQELEHLYFAGHLDYLRRTEQKRVQASFKPFLAPPGGRMLPGAALEMRKHAERQRKVQKREAAQQKRDNERDFLGLRRRPICYETRSHRWSYRTWASRSRSTRNYGCGTSPLRSCLMIKRKTLTKERIGRCGGPSASGNLGASLLH